MYKLIEYPIEINIKTNEKYIDGEEIRSLVNTNLGIHDSSCSFFFENGTISCILYSTLPLLYHTCKQLFETFTKENLQEITNTSFSSIDIDCEMIKYLNL